MSRRDDAERDRGSIAPLVPIIMFALLLLGGLVVDGTRALNSRGNAQAYAEEAARAGASAILPDQPTLLLDIEGGGVTRNVSAYCEAIRGLHANVSVDSCGLDDPAFSLGSECDGSKQMIVVHTKVRVTVNTTLLGLAHVSQFSATSVASARPVEGINGADRCSG